MYLSTLAKFDSLKFAELRELYLPSIKFDFEDPLQYISQELFKKGVPATILNGTYDKQTFKLFLRQNDLNTLHLSFENQEFLDLVFDSDLRRKIDGMALSPVFRRIDIINEFQTISPILLDLYLDCFAQFKQINSLRVYVNTYIGDKIEMDLFDRIIQTTSRQFIRVLLDLKVSENNPKQNIERACNIINYKLQEALLTNDSNQIEKWIKLSTAVSEKLHRLGSGTKSDLQELLNLLQQDKDFEEPHIYTREELDSLPPSQELIIS